MRRWPGWLVAVLSLAGCLPPRPDIVADEPVPLWRLARHGYAIDPALIRSLDGRRLTIWGYLDVANIAVRRDRFPGLERGWWLPPTAPHPYFDLKSRIDDKTGESTRVLIVANEQAFRPFFQRLLTLARRDPPGLRIEVTGTLRPFEAPTNFRSATGFVVEVDDPAGIRLRR